MKKTTASVFVVLIGAILISKAFAPSSVAAGYDTDNPVKAPEFNHQAAEDWVNSAPITLADSNGKVRLVHFWTFGCWNCYRSFPWLNAMEQRLKDMDVQFIGVHSPEFDHEKELDRIKAKVKKFGLAHPTMVDNDHSYWKAMHNRYWPAYYLIDQKGYIRQIYIGETHEGDAKARRIENHINKLLQNGTQT